MNIDDTLKERGGTHGDFFENSFLSQSMKRLIRNSDGYQYLTNSQRESLDMIVHKISRILAGNPNHKDHWTDIAGYARLVEKQLNEPV